MPLSPTDAVNYKTEDFSKRVAEVTSGNGVDIVIDFIAQVRRTLTSLRSLADYSWTQEYWNGNIASLAFDGRMVLLATMSGGSMPPGAQITPILYKRLRIQGSTLRSRSVEYQTQLVQGFKRDVLDKIEGCGHGDGRLKVYVHKVSRLKEAATKYQSSNTSVLI